MKESLKQARGDIMSLEKKPESSPKRMEKGTSERHGDQSRHKRASKACLTCRRRKVRCDVAQRGPPCLNCFLDKGECMVKPRSSKHRVNNRESVSEQAPSIVHGSSSKPASESSPAIIVKSPFTNQGDQSMQDELTGTSSVNHEDPENHAFYHLPTSDHERRTAGNTETVQASAEASSDFAIYNSANLSKEPSTEQNLESQSTGNTHITFSYYPFVKLSAMSKIAAEDVNFLDAQGCFRVPTRPILDEFIQEYFLHIHPILPIINEKTFWKMYDEYDPTSYGATHISLLVFHAMLFAASSFVSLPSVQKLGFDNNRTARASYFRRAKLLFEFDSEIDPISMAQATLLMSYFSPMRIFLKANTYWLGIAIQFAKHAEAHRYQTKRDVTMEQRNTLKRLWWSCILRDRILHLGVRKSIQVTPLDFDLNTQETLVIEDLESEFFTSRVYDAITKRALAQRLVALCELAVVLTDVILILYPDKEPFVALERQSHNDVPNAVRTCKLELNTWFEKTTIRCWTSPDLSETHESVLLYTNLMHIYYHSAVIALCNHEVLLAMIEISPGSSGNNGLAQIYNLKRQIEDAITGVTDNLKEIVQLKLAKYMPVSVVAYAALPLVLHLLDVKLSSTSFRTAKKQRQLSIYTEAMKALHSRYDVTTGVTEIINKMVEHMSLDPPGLQSETRSHHLEVDPGSHAIRSANDPSIVQDWGDVLLRQPRLYLRLATTVDLSLSIGNFPTDSDFPMPLQSKLKSTSGKFPLYHILMDGTKSPLYPQVRRQNTANFNSNIVAANEYAGGGSLGGLEKPLSSTSNNKIMTPALQSPIDLYSTRFELPIGFEAFDIELL